MKQTKANLRGWKADRKDTLPNFIIGGAMKSGTTSIHEILAKHPDIFIPNGEIHFFDIDNIFEHNDFFHYDKKIDRWYYPVMDNDPEKLWSWYNKKFNSKTNETLLGEDSTTYLASKIAAKRLALQDKDIKFIFVLRQPTLRAFSQYKHMLRTGRVMFNFEDTLQYTPFSLINRSLYKEQLESYYKLFPKENIKIVLFEDYIENPKKEIIKIFNFLNVESSKLNNNHFSIHANKSLIPYSKNLQFLKNKFFRNKGNQFYLDKLPHFLDRKAKINDSIFTKNIMRLFYLINPQTKDNIKIKSSTKTFLDEYFKKELDGLDELVGMKIFEKWF